MITHPIMLWFLKRSGNFLVVTWNQKQNLHPFYQPLSMGSMQIANGRVQYAGPRERMVPCEMVMPSLSSFTGFEK